MGEVFEDAVEVVVARPAKFSDSSIILYELSKRDPVPGPPRALAQFLLHLLRGQQRPMYEGEYVLAICRRVGETGDADLERELQERFVEVGCSGALFPENN